MEQDSLKKSKLNLESVKVESIILHTYDNYLIYYDAIDITRTVHYNISVAKFNLEYFMYSMSEL